MSGERPRLDLRTLLGPLYADLMGLPPVRPSGAEWDAIVRKYREWLAKKGNADRRPTQTLIAEEMRCSERTLVRRLRELRVEDWRDVHALVLSEP